MEPYDVLTGMKNRLRETGLYTLDGTTLVDAELAAYAAGFAPLMASYDELCRELMVQTAESYGIDQREMLLGNGFLYLPLETRRQMLLARLAMSGNDYTADALQRALDSVGIVSTITEQPSSDSILVKVTDVSRVSSKTQAAVKALAEQFLPAHLCIAYDFSAVPILAVDS
ncbi:MAG: hypothetical protein PUC32_03515 [Oscillospiraceae bacterium]|nr:hypothetical protein [Oscillospiraceae bacterium]